MKHLVIDDFLTPEQCYALIEQATPHVQATTSWDVEKGRDQVTDYRVGQQYFFQRGQNELVREVEEKCAKLSGYPVENGEGMQFIKYIANGHYRPHFDYFDPRYDGNKNQLARGGQRVITIIMYLNTVEDGTGCTWFPKSKVRVEPIQGRAFMWWNVKKDGSIDESTIHEGTDVGPGSVKYILTKWIRSSTFV